MCEVWMCGFQGTQNPIRFPVTMAKGIHLFPYRTQKLSLSAPMVLGWRRPGRVGRCRIPQRKASDECLGLFFVYPEKSFFQLIFDEVRERTWLGFFLPPAVRDFRQEKSPGRVGGRTRKKRFSFRLQCPNAPVIFDQVRERTWLDSSLRQKALL